MARATVHAVSRSWEEQKSARLSNAAELLGTSLKYSQLRQQVSRLELNHAEVFLSHRRSLAIHEYQCPRCMVNLRIMEDDSLSSTTDYKVPETAAPVIRLQTLK